MADEVRAWLASLKLEQYASSFIENGYDDLSALADMDDKDLDTLGITRAGHRKRILVSGTLVPEDPRRYAD